MWFLLLLTIVAVAITAPLAGWRMDTSHSTAADAPHNLKLVIGVISAACLGASYFLRRIAIRQASWRWRAAGLTPLLYMYLMTLAFSAAFSIGIFGLVVYYLEGSLLWLSLFVAISIAALFLLRPREKDLVSLGVRS